LKDKQNNFLTHKDYEQHREKYADLIGPSGSLLFVACDAGKELAINVKKEYQTMLEKKHKNGDVIDIPLMTDITNKFEGSGHDGSCPRIPQHVGGVDAYIFQNCMDKRKDGESVNYNLKELEHMISTIKSNEGSRVTAVIPYYPYSRQDKPSFMQREAPLARRVADALVEAKVDRVISYHPHSTSLVGFFPANVPFRYISGLDLAYEMFSKFKGDKETIAFCTDAGGIKETIHLADALNLNFGLSAKHRPKQKKTDALGILGNTQGKKRAIITDDETATFSSCLGVIKLLNQDYGIEEFHLGISHMRLEPQYIDRLKEANEKYGMVELHTTDSVPQIDVIKELSFVKIHSLAKTWAFVINRMHYNLSVSEIFYNPKK
jgi:ribose-phosphate pyrophosphokinase